MLDFLAGASLLPVAFKAIGVNQQNQANAEAASEAFTRSQTSAREQMAFQEKMSSTAHQRQVQDLKAAGLNPILSVNAGSSSPSGGSASASAPHMENMMDAEMMMQGLMTKAQLDKTQADIEKSKAEVGYTNQLTKKAKVDTIVAGRDLPEAEMKQNLYQKLKSLALQSAPKRGKPFTRDEVKKFVPKSSIGKKRFGKGIWLD